MHCSILSCCICVFFVVVEGPFYSPHAPNGHWKLAPKSKSLVVNRTSNSRQPSRIVFGIFLFWVAPDRAVSASHWPASKRPRTSRWPMSAASPVQALFMVRWILAKIAKTEKFLQSIRCTPDQPCTGSGCAQTTALQVTLLQFLSLVDLDFLGYLPITYTNTIKV
jgi:hypothetical protein